MIRLRLTIVTRTWSYHRPRWGTTAATPAGQPMKSLRSSMRRTMGIPLGQTASQRMHASHAAGRRCAGRSRHRAHVRSRSRYARGAQKISPRQIAIVHGSHAPPSGAPADRAELHHMAHPSRSHTLRPAISPISVRSAVTRYRSSPPRSRSVRSCSALSWR